MVPLREIEGRKFCVVFVKVVDEGTGRVQLQCLRGRANVEGQRVSLVDTHGGKFTIPSIAVANILPSDGTPLLKDAEYFCLVKVDPRIPLTPNEEETFL